MVVKFYFSKRFIKIAYTEPLKTEWCDFIIPMVTDKNEKKPIANRYYDYNKKKVGRGDTLRIGRKTVAKLSIYSRQETITDNC